MKKYELILEIKKRKKIAQLFFLIPALLLIQAKCANDSKDTTDSVKEPVVFTPVIPVDVDPALQNKLKEEGRIYELNEAFNEFSWKAFVAIFWPRDKEGKPKEHFYDEGESTWLDWKEAYQVYRQDGGVPAPWNSPRSGGGYKISNEIVGEENTRILLTNQTPAFKRKSKNIADEEDQAFAGKLFDQNGNIVYYEVLMNEEEFDYVVANKLYNINGQIAFSKDNPVANFPAGDYEKNELGAVEIKFAWKILEANDVKERYYRNWGYIKDANGNLEKKELGMIGFHISQKTPTGKQWVWSTFEQIDNLDQNVMEKDGKKQVISPSLTDPNCEICPVNVDVSNNTTYAYHKNSHGAYWSVSGNTSKYYAKDSIMKTQAKRMVDIPVRVQLINQKMQAYFKSKNSVFQYYQLIDTQYPLNQNAAPASHTEEGYHLPQSVNNKSGGEPNIALLTNITMETFFQGGNQSASDLMENNPNSDFTIFGTESCIGCHSSAGIYNGYSKGNFTTGDQLSGDFSWLLSQRAHWDKNIPLPSK